MVGLKFPCFNSFSLGHGLPRGGDPWPYLSLEGLEREHGLLYLRNTVRRSAELVYPFHSHR